MYNGVLVMASVLVAAVTTVLAADGVAGQRHRQISRLYHQQLGLYKQPIARWSKSVLALVTMML